MIFNIRISEAIGLFIIGLTCALFVVMPAAASAAVYGYVDTTGQVKSVTADDWMTAMATAPGIHMHSGVFLFTMPSDYMIVGEMIGGVN